MSKSMSIGHGAATATTRSAKTASDEIAAFMARVVPWPEEPDDGFINIHWLRPDGGGGMPGHAVRTVDEFLEQVDALKSRRANLYFCLSQQAKAKPNGSSRLAAVRNRQNARALKAIWFDIDVKGTDGAKHYPSGRVALAELSKFIARAGLPHPSAIVASGSGGYHVYWISKSPLTPEEWQRYADGLKAKAQELGLLADLGCTGDVARVLRVPGTLNFKSDPPKPVVLQGMGEDYDFPTAFQALAVVGKSASRPAAVSRSVARPAIAARFAGRPLESLGAGIDLGVDELDPEPLFKLCGFLRTAKETGGRDYAQPLWHQTIRCAVYLKDGNELAHAFSKGHKDYAYDETEQMWERVSRESKEKDLGWPQCRTIKANGYKDCEGCLFFKEGKSPLNMALRTSKTDVAIIFDQVKQGKLTPVTALMTLRDQGANIDALLAAMNENYAVVKYGGQTIVATISADDIGFMKVEDFHRMFANLFFDPIDGLIRQLKQRVEQMGNGVVSMTFEDFRDRVADLIGVSRDPNKLSKRWFEWKGRRHYLGRGVVFEPGKPLEILNDMLNLWRGFGIVPQPGNWSLMQSHILNVVCSGDREAFDYLIKWMAYAVQHPHKQIGVAVAFLGPQGAGKGVLARTFGSFFGKHFVHITHGDQLTGRFNASLGTSCAVFLDEALWAGDKKGEGTLKALITEPTFQMEAKFRDPIMVENRLRIMVASNNDWAVPTGVGDRRWFVLNVADTYAGTKHRDYWTALYAEIENGGAAAMLHGLLAMDLNGFDVRAIPHTAAKAQQQAYSFRGPTAWLYDILQEGAIGPEKWNEAGLTISKNHAYECYKEFSKERREWQPEIKDLWSRKIRKMLGPCVEGARPTAKGERVYSLKFAPLADCRRRFETHVGAPEWEASVAPEPATDTTVRQTADHLGDPTVLDAVGDAPSIECEQESEPEDWADYELNCEPEDEPEYESEDGSN